MDSHNILSLLGLALRGGRLAVGEEPVEAAARARDARVLLVASDASDNTCRRVEHFAQAGQCLWLRLPFTKAELGRHLGRSAVAVAAVTDVGLACAVVGKLAALDSAAYGEAAARLEVKAKRAAERRAELHAHEKNVRSGKRRPKKDAPRQTPDAAPDKRKEVRSPSGRAMQDRAAEGSGNPRRRPSRPPKENRPRPRTNPYAHSRPVKKGKGSFRKKPQ